MSAFIDEQAEVSDKDDTASEHSEPVAKKRKTPAKKRRNIA